MNIIENIQFNEFDQLALTSALKSYKYPKDKITSLIEAGLLLRVKRGIYIKSKGKINNFFYSKEIIANLIYGPSYISLEYALSFHGIIPERVEVVTSVTNKRKKNFHTPIGSFSYSAINKLYYPAGVHWQKMDDGRGFFIASPEKALIDKLYFEEKLYTQKEMAQYIFENLRIEKERIKEFNTNLVKEILSPYKKKSLLNLIKIIEKL